MIQHVAADQSTDYRGEIWPIPTRYRRMIIRLVILFVVPYYTSVSVYNIRAGASR
jgi:hypothetical protein